MALARVAHSRRGGVVRVSGVVQMRTAAVQMKREMVVRGS